MKLHCGYCHHEFPAPHPAMGTRNATETLLRDGLVKISCPSCTAILELPPVDVIYMRPKPRPITRGHLKLLRN